MKELALGTVMYFFVKRHNSSECTQRKQEVRVELGDLRSRNRVCKMSEIKTLYGLKCAVTMIIMCISFAAVASSWGKLKCCGQ